jgi:hypothetical protein
MSDRQWQKPAGTDDHQAISIVQRGNLKALETTLRKQWRLGQNIVLCWSADTRGLLVLFVPHYYLGNYCAGGDAADNNDNEAFIRQLISGGRRKNREQLFAIAERLDVSPTFIKLDTALSEEGGVLESVEQLIKRYGLSYVDERAVLLFDIVDFSLVTPFEQASQLNSLSYSLNSAYNKLLARGIEINFARTTTGDGYYVWNRDLGPYANQNLFYFLMLVVADNRAALEASRGNTVPVVRAAYHIGSHYELYQAEGVNPTVFSYIVGDVTIELARLLDHAAGNQVLIGDFNTSMKTRGQAVDAAAVAVTTAEFVRACDSELDVVLGTPLSGKTIVSMHCHLTGEPRARRIQIVDKHGLNHCAYNLQLEIALDDKNLSLGLSADALPDEVEVAELEAPIEESPQPGHDATAEQLLDGLASMMRRRSERDGNGD